MLPFFKGGVGIKSRTPYSIFENADQVDLPDWDLNACFITTHLVKSHLNLDFFLLTKQP